jgi:RHS repeat-associated protein
VVTLTYTADGEKLSKVVTGGGAAKNYVAGIEYSGANLEAIYHGEGRCTPNGATAFHYEYTLKDHLGNARVNFRANGATVTFLEEAHYYPFGMQMEGIGAAAVTQNKYKYNGKELNDDFGLNWYNYGKRWYDPSIGRFPTIDPLADTFNFVTPYNYAENEPVAHIDLWGLQKLKPNMQPIEKPGDLLSMKMLNNLWEATKTAGREFLTEPVGEMIKEAGDAVGKAGLLVSAAAPPAGGAMMGTGAALEVGGGLIIAADEYIDTNAISEEKATNLIFDAAYELALPEFLEGPINNSGLKQEAKEVVKFQLRAVSDVVKSTHENLNNINQELPKQ